MTKLSTWQKRTLQIVLSLSVFAVLIYYIDGERVSELLGRVSVLYLLAMFVVNLADRVFMAWKWNRLLRVFAVSISEWAAFKLYYQACFLGFAVPFGIGPDIVRFFQLSQSGLKGAQVMASIILERLLGLLATLIVLLLGLAILFRILPSSEVTGQLMGVVIALLIFTCLLFVLLLSDTIWNRLSRWASLPRLSEKIRLGEYYEAFVLYRRFKSTTLNFTLLSCFEQFFAILTTYFAAKALGIPLGLLTCIAFVPVTVLAERLPVSFLGIGFREGSYVLVLSLLGIDYTSAMMLGLTCFFMDIVVAIPAGLWYLTDSIPLRRGS